MVSERCEGQSRPHEAARAIKTRRLPPDGSPWIAAVSRSHGDARTEAFIDGRPGATNVKQDSRPK